MTKARRIRQELKALRANCIDNVDDPILRKIAYEVECAVRYVTEDVRSWPDLESSVRAGADLLRKELRKENAA